MRKLNTMLVSLYHNWIENQELKWKESKPHFSLKQWFDIFPEARLYLADKIEVLGKRNEFLKVNIKRLLAKLYRQVSDEDSLWFGEALVRVWLGNELDKNEIKIRKLDWLLNPPKPKKGQITDEMLYRAKESGQEIENWRRFVEVKKRGNGYWALCHNHADEHPSLFIRNGFCYCFSCGYSADLIKFVQDTQNFSFLETVKQLA